MKNNRFLNMTYAIETLNGRLNTSAKEVENNIGGYDNITFTKKVNGKAYVSAVCIKKNIKRYIKEEGFDISEYIKNGKKITIEANPQKFINEDLFGFMRADKEEITQEQYDELEDDIKKLYNKDKKAYTRNITKKRSANFAMNGMIGVNKGKLQKEWGVCSTTGDSMPYVLETYSDILVGLGNLNINDTSKFTISDIESEFRDYSPEEAKILNIEEQLSKEEKFNRIETTLRGVQYLSLKSNQSNYLVDTMPKLVIMSEYSWGNNMFQGLINKDGVDIEGFKEILDEYDNFRKSDIWIGVSSRIENEQFKGLKVKLQEELKEYDFIHIATVGKAFDGYLEYLKETI